MSKIGRDALVEMVRAGDALMEASRALFSRWDLSPAQFNVLSVLEPTTEGFTQTELSDLLVTHRSNVTGLVDRMEKREWLNRTPDPTDRRVNRIVLTQKGRDLLDTVRPHYFEIADQIWGDRPDDAGIQLGDLLRDIRNASLESAHELAQK